MRNWRALLEETYRLGPAALHLDELRAHAPLWLLSNHRSHWLEPRLRRFGLTGYFQRILVSDRIGQAKPEPGAFAPLLRSGYAPETILFLDDRERNIKAARTLGLNAILVGPDGAWLHEVRHALLPTHAGTATALKS